MTALLPHQKFEIKTRLSSVAARQKLMEIVEPRRMRWGWSRNHLPFEGEVEVNTFRFSRVINYRNSFLPILEGEIQNDLDVTKLVITAHLHELVMILWPIMGLGMLAVMSVTGEPVGYWMIIPLAAIILGAPTIAFHWELNKAKKILNEHLETDEYSSM